MAKAKNTRAAAQGAGTIYLADGSHIHTGGLDGHAHDHNDPSTKNAVSRAALTTDPRPPTRPRPRRRVWRRAPRPSSAAEPEPKLSNVPVSAPHAASPTNRYNMFNACYGVQSARTSRWLTGANGPTFTAASIGERGAPLYFKPTELGRYMLYSRARTLPRRRPGPPWATRPTPAPASNWVATMPRSGLFPFQIPGKGYLADTGSNATVTSTGTLVPAAPCAAAARRSPRSAPTSRATRSPA